MISDSDYNRLCWASRRGMLELDLMMVPFVQNCFKSLEPEDQQRYIDLLESEDNDLFAWCLGREKPEDPDLALIIEKIIAYAKQPK